MKSCKINVDGSLLTAEDATLNSPRRLKPLPAERAIHFAIFTLLLMGMCAVSAWVCYAYLQPLILQIAGIAMSWGVILLVLYAGFIKLGWQWWNQ